MTSNDMVGDTASTEAFQNLSPDTILDAVESIGLQSDGRLLALNSYENRVYQIGIEDGQPLVVKFYRPQRWSDETILEEHGFTQELADQEIPVIPPICYQGKTLHHYGLHRFTFYQRKGGHAPELDNPDHLEQMGRFIGRIHAMAAAKDFQYRPQLDLQSYGITPRTFLLENKFIPAHLEEAYASLTEDVITRIKNCYQRAEKAGEIAGLRLHGDLHPGNILWTDDGPHIVDFDDARTGPAIQDLWMFLSGDRQYMTARLGDLLIGYEDFYEFNSSELNLVEALRSMRIIHHSYWLANRWDDPAFPQAFPWFNSTNYWEEHILSLREQIALMDEEPLVWD